jgi:glycosyltransferase involved in cell wall biosynthesis
MTPATIAIPAYNAESTLAQTLDSALNQSLKDIEVLIVNDGSQDGTTRVMEQYAKNDGRIALISHDTNQGVFAARKTCVENARGEYIFWLDADDWIEPDALERLSLLAGKMDADMVFFGKFLEEKDGSIRRMYLSCDDKYKTILYLIRRLCVMNPMVKTDVAKKAVFPPFSCAEDVVLSIQCAVYSRDGGIASLPYFLHHYAYNPVSICRNPRNVRQNRIDHIAAFDWTSAFLTEHGYPELAKIALEEKAPNPLEKRLWLDAGA